MLLESLVNLFFGRRLKLNPVEFSERRLSASLHGPTGSTLNNEKMGFRINS
jgi:hypothetical protein